MFASVNSGRPPWSGGCEDKTVAFLAESEIVSEIFSTEAACADVSAVMQFGRTVIMIVPLLTFE
ncbi:unannotated protein [freshwater metagenome]|uniref:Unannotated protein n=1 Tax=freshwater metagenome TaxID=449393 RepID=A0A6J7SNQ6_9ZZZZ